MEIQPSNRSMKPLLAVAILTSMVAIAPGESRSSDLSQRTANQRIRPIESTTEQGNSLSADAVAEARWARMARDYVLGAAGRIVPDERRAAAVNTDQPDELDGEGEPDSRQYHFDILLSDSETRGEPECGPSSATPEEITRLVIEAARRHRVDVCFALAVVTAESRLDRLRNSPKGARGPMQLMPATAERFGVSDICDPAENIDGGVRYLRELVDEFRNPLLVAAAYNAGEGRVRQHGGIPPFQETVGYVAEVLNIQMGLEGTAPIARERSVRMDEQQPASKISGVITSRDRRQWVGGVVHF
jgi:soluble lytic murein transglycosylase-like protein